jgi:2-haloacid dehalogenase
VKIYKPSPRVYALISPRLRVPANEIGFVSSNSWDVNGAGAAGLFTFWIQRSAAEPQEELGFPARYVVGAITDLDALIARG